MLYYRGGLITDSVENPADSVHRRKWDIETGSELQKLFEGIDNELIEERSSITARLMLAGCKITEKYDVVLPFFSPRRAPKAENFSPVEVSIRLTDFFEGMYGRRLEVPFTIGRVAFRLRGDYYAVNCPQTYGSVSMVCDPLRFGIRNEEQDLSAECNIIDLVEDLTTSLAHSFSSEEVVKLGILVTTGMAHFMALRAVEGAPLVADALGDYDSAVMHLVSNNRSPGQSVWSSLQAVEKMLKSFLMVSGVDFPHTHNLERLTDLAINQGLTPPPANYIKALNYKAGVRYGEIPVSARRAEMSHMLSLEMGEVIGQCIGNKLGKSMPSVPEPLVDEMPLNEFLKIHGVLPPSDSDWDELLSGH